MCDKTFKERGLGDVKILRNKTTGKSRIILRREKIHKLACNHLLTPNMTLKPLDKSNGTAWVWYAVDFSEQESKDEMFAIRYALTTTPYLIYSTYVVKLLYVILYLMVGGIDVFLGLKRRK
jgi:hypothetical protein